MPTTSGLSIQRSHPINRLMRARPIFLVALCLAVVAGASALALRGGKSRAERFQAAISAEQTVQQKQEAAGRPYLPETVASIDSLKLHHGFRRLATGCQVEFVRCYLVAQPPEIAASELPSLLKSIGADTGPVGPFFAGVRAFQRELRAEGLKDPTPTVNLNGCTRGPAHPWLVHCTYLGLLDHNEIVAILGPHIRCDSATRACHFSGKTEILFSIP